VKKGGLYSLDISSVYQYKNTLIGFKVYAESNVSTSFNVLEVLPSTKLAISVKLPDCNARKISTAFIISEVLPYRKLVVSVKLPDDPLKVTTLFLNLLMPVTYVC